MKIERIQVARIEQSLWGAFWDAQAAASSSSPMSRFPEYAGSLQSWWCPQAVVVVRIETGEAAGIGWAEDPVGGASGAIERHFARLLLGRDASQIERIWEILYRSSIPYGRRGTMLHAISAIDIALWDIAGKAAGKPVAALLGGDVERSLPAYASGLQPYSLDLFRQEIKGYIADGFRAMKMRMPGHAGLGAAGIAANVERFAVAREVAGPAIDLAADAYMGWDLRFAKRMTEAASEFRLSWIEEPLLPDEIDAYAALCSYSRIPIAHGENECTRYGFAEIIRNHAAHLLQPDVHRVGGITETIRVASLASAAGLEVLPHAFSAPTVHAMAAIPNCGMLEVLTVPVWARARPAASQPVVLDEPRVEGGLVRLSARPGLGIRLNEEAHPALKGWNQ